MATKILTLEEKLQKKFKGYKFGVACAVHDHNSFVPLEDHHIHPKEYHGPDTKLNLVRICSNGHGETHYLLELLLATGRTEVTESLLAIPVVIRRRFGIRVRSLACRGFAGIMHSEVTPEGLNA